MLLSTEKRREPREELLYLATPSSINAFHLERQRWDFLAPYTKTRDFSSYSTLPSHAAIQREEGKRGTTLHPVSMMPSRETHTEGDFLTSLLSCHAAIQREERREELLAPPPCLYAIQRPPDSDAFASMLSCHIALPYCSVILLSRSVLSHPCQAVVTTIL